MVVRLGAVVPALVGNCRWWTGIVIFLWILIDITQVTKVVAFSGPSFLGIGRRRQQSQSALHISLSTSWTDGTAFVPRNDTAAAFGFDAYKDLSVAIPHHHYRPQQRHQQFKVFCDLDGVLVDFEHGIRKLFPDLDTKYHPQQDRPLQIQDLERSTMWRKVASADAFFEGLPWTREGRRLWEYIRPLQPDILTGVPVMSESSRREKFAWCQRELGVDVTHVDMAGSQATHASEYGHERQDGICNVITCWSSNKHYESGPGAILIDDREQLREAWEAAGGIFVHHTGNVDATLQQLRELGVLPAADDNSSIVRP